MDVGRDPGVARDCPDDPGPPGGPSPLDHFQRRRLRPDRRHERPATPRRGAGPLLSPSHRTRDPGGRSSPARLQTSEVSSATGQALPGSGVPLGLLLRPPRDHGRYPRAHGAPPSGSALRVRVSTLLEDKRIQGRKLHHPVGPHGGGPTQDSDRDRPDAGTRTTRLVRRRTSRGVWLPRGRGSDRRPGVRQRRRGPTVPDHPPREHGTMGPQEGSIGRGFPGGGPREQPLLVQDALGEDRLGRTLPAAAVPLLPLPAGHRDHGLRRRLSPGLHLHRRVSAPARHPKTHDRPLRQPRRTDPIRQRLRLEGRPEGSPEQTPPG